MSRFRPNDKLYRTEQMISTELDQETVLMSIEAGAYYGLEATAQSIWQALETPLTFSALVERLTGEYEVTPEACAADLEPFLVALEQEGLLRVE
jgi:hypothetical protein